jgi:hypothetical protein
LEDQLIYRKTITELILKKQDWSELSEFILLRTGTSEMKCGYLPNMGQERKILYTMEQVTKAIQC